MPRVRDIVKAMYARIPTGVGASRRDLRLSPAEVKGLLQRGAGWAVDRGFGSAADLDNIEEGGVLDGADPSLVSSRALERGQMQIGTLGSGNHFAELQYVSEIYDEHVAEAFGLARNRVTVMIHSGSRGLGHQVCEDHLRIMVRAADKYGIKLPDRQLACAPIRSHEGRDYLAAMSAAANFAFANRQVMAHQVRESIADAMAISVESTGVRTVYDVCHNIAKMETFAAGTVCVHRKGATRAYPPGHAATPSAYREVGQPVLIPGDMGRYSYVLAGTDVAFRDTFGSTCHGAGRRWSRSEAKRQAKGQSVIKDLESRGVVVMAAGLATVAEEMPAAYKDVADVVRVVHDAGLAHRVAQLRPLGVIKG